MRGMRADRGSRKIELSSVKEALRDRRYWLGVGIVVHPSGESSHYELDPDVGYLVHVELMPDREPLMCRLAGTGTGGATGGWKIPNVGDEVAVGIPGGQLENDPILLCTLASGATPNELDATTYVVKAPKIVISASNGTVTIMSDGSIQVVPASGQTVQIGDSSLTAFDGVVTGQGIDPFTGTKYALLGSASSVVLAKKS